MISSKDPYTILGIDLKILSDKKTEQEKNDYIKEQFHNLARKIHPDKLETKVESTASYTVDELTTAFRKIKDTKARKEYSASLKVTTKASLKTQSADLKKQIDTLSADLIELRKGLDQTLEIQNLQATKLSLQAYKQKITDDFNNLPVIKDSKEMEKIEKNKQLLKSELSKTKQAISETEDKLKHISEKIEPLKIIILGKEAELAVLKDVLKEIVEIETDLKFIKDRTPSELSPFLNKPGLSNKYLLEVMGYAENPNEYENHIIFCVNNYDDPHIETVLNLPNLQNLSGFEEFKRIVNKAREEKARMAAELAERQRQALLADQIRQAAEEAKKAEMGPPSATGMFVPLLSTGDAMAAGTSGMFAQPLQFGSAVPSAYQYGSAPSVGMYPPPASSYGYPPIMPLPVLGMPFFIAGYSYGPRAPGEMLGHTVMPHPYAATESAASMGASPTMSTTFPPHDPMTYKKSFSEKDLANLNHLDPDIHNIDSSLNNYSLFSPSSRITKLSIPKLNNTKTF